MGIHIHTLIGANEAGIFDIFPVIKYMQPRRHAICVRDATRPSTRSSHTVGVCEYVHIMMMGFKHTNMFNVHII